MKLSTINLINDVLTEAVMKAVAEFNEADKAAQDCFNVLKVTLGESVTKVELDKIYGNSEQRKKASAARSRLMLLEQGREDFLGTDWR